jgi:hypothetical protein
MGANGSYVPKESPMPYETILRQENEGLKSQNGYYLNDLAGMSTT